MKKKLLLLTWLLVLASLQAFGKRTISITPAQAQKIGYQIWKNESNGSVEGLTHWNAQEAFPSLGIGHCIWYPVGSSNTFSETFPALLIFLRDHQCPVPAWLFDVHARPIACPWPHKKAFDQAIHSSRMKELRTLLCDTVDQQIYFMLERFRQTISQMLKDQALAKRAALHKKLFHLTQTTNGLYALIDYVNFKGSGMSANEPWGLRQVLEGMLLVHNAQMAVAEFVRSAKQILQKRVTNAPARSPDKGFLPGWYNRLDTYTKPL